MMKDWKQEFTMQSYLSEYRQGLHMTIFNRQIYKCIELCICMHIFIYTLKF